jgi:peptidoglycan L-alanyl-D-glutamate endopeptidase CwlK
MGKKKFTLSKSSKGNLEGVKENIIELVNRSLSKSKVDFGIPSYGGLRTAKDQYTLFMIRPHVTKIDGYKIESYHQSGNAFDIFVYDEHGACWKCKDKYADIAEVIKFEFELMIEEGLFSEDAKLEWGGDWKSWKDLPHFQIVYGK